MAKKMKMATEISEKRILVLLPDDIILDILSRLPVKSIKRFGCVCKSWFATFQNPDFIRNYNRNPIRGSNLNVAIKNVPDYFSGHAIDNPHGFDYFLLSNTTMQVRESVHIPDLHSGSMILGECEGLIWSYCLDDRSCIAISNPATKEFKLVDHPSDYWRTIGFGYDYTTDDFKLVRLGCEVELYSLRTNSWKQIPSPLHYDDMKIRYPFFSTYLNGCYHWWLPVREEILSFDMVKEEFQKTMAFPPDFVFGYDDDVEFVDLRVFNNYLAVFLRMQDASYEVWVMKEYGITESWTKELVVGPILRARHLLGMWTNGEWFFKTNDYGMEIYDPKTEAVMAIGNEDAYCRCSEMAEPDDCCSCGIELGLVVYKESLFSLTS